MNKEKKLAIVSTVGIFLAYEILAFVSFGLSNSFQVYSFIAIPVMLLLFIAHFFEIKKEGISSILLFIFPFALFGIICSLGSLGSGHLSILTRVLIPLCFISFATLGYLTSFNKGFKISTALVLIYGGLALIVLLSFFATMVQFVPFYTIIHRNSYIYYNGGKSPVSIGEMAYFLAGFSFREVSVDYFTLYPTVLSTSVIALFFISPKKELKKFVLFAIYTFIGLITLVLMPTKMTLITDVLLLVLVVLVVLFGKNKINNKIFAKVMLVLGILLGIAFIILFLNAQVDWEWTSGLRNAIAGNSFLNRLFNTNRLSSKYNVLLNGSLNLGWWLGFLPSREFASSPHFGFFSNSMLFDTILMNGIFGLLILVIILVVIVKSFIKYCKNSGDSALNKALIAGLLLSILGYGFVNYDTEPYVFYSNLMPIYFNGLFLVAMFLMGYVFKQANPFVPKKEKANEEAETTSNENEEENVNEEQI